MDTFQRANKRFWLFKHDVFFFLFLGEGGLGSIVVVVVVFVVVVVGILFGMVFIRTFFFWILVVVSPVEKGKEGMLLCDPCCSNPECRFS